VLRLLVQRCGPGSDCDCDMEGPVDRGAVAQLAATAGNAAVVGLLQRQPSGGSKLDDTAKAIVAAAQDSSKPVAERAVQLVRSIISTYLSGDSGLVKDVKFDDKYKGLNTESQGSKEKTVGVVSVGSKFVEQATERGFARRVIQVDHELEHVRQHRAGMGGGKRKDEREFLAFHREALESEFAGTGKVDHGTRIAVIDAALGNYYCLSDDDRKKYEDKRQGLLAEREKHNGKGGHPSTDPPTACKRSE